MFNGQAAFATAGREGTDPVYAGLVVFADPNNTHSVALNGNASFTPTSNGSVYARKATIVLNGNTSLTLPANSTLVAGNVTINGNATLAITHR